MSLFEEVAVASIVAYVQRISLYFVLPSALLLLFAALLKHLARAKHSREIFEDIIFKQSY